MGGVCAGAVWMTIVGGCVDDHRGMREAVWTTMEGGCVDDQGAAVWSGIGPLVLCPHQYNPEIQREPHACGGTHSDEFVLKCDLVGQEPVCKLQRHKASLQLLRSWCLAGGETP